jgi:hypothetical protein
MMGHPSTVAVNSAADEENVASSEKDAALAIVNSDMALEIDPGVEKLVLRKIDLFFMPAMLIGLDPWKNCK